MVIPVFGDGMIDLTLDHNKFDPEHLPIIATKDLVLFPGMTMPLTVGRTKSLRALEHARNKRSYIGIFLQATDSEEPEEKDLYRIGCIADIVKVLEMPDGNKSVILQGRHIARLDKMVDEVPYLNGSVSLVDELRPEKGNRKMKATLSLIKDDLKEMMTCADNNLPPELAFALTNFQDQTQSLTAFLCSSFPMAPEERQSLIESSDIVERMTKLHIVVNRQLQYARLKNKIHQDTQQELSEQQRRHFLLSQI